MPGEIVRIHVACPATIPIIKAREKENRVVCILKIRVALPTSLGFRRVDMNS